MKLIKEIKRTLKIVKKINEVKRYLAMTHLSNDIKNDIAIIKEAAKRLGNKIAAVKDLVDMIF